MIPLDDPRWKALKGGSGRPYDASAALRRLEQGDDAWEELWTELHHQGSVGEASYAAVPHLVRIAQQDAVRDWHLYSLVAIIEIERHRKTNPPLPEWVEESYRIAWSDLTELALADLRSVEDKYTLRSILGAIALSKGELKLGALITISEESEIDEILEQYDAWSECYVEQDHALDAHKDERK